MTCAKMLAAASVALLVLLPPYAAAQRPANATDPRPTNRTVYTDRTELFITFRPPFITGQATRVGAHLSKLGDRFLPYADAAVTATLTVGGTTARASAIKPDRPGVFRLELTPTKAGTGTLVIEISGRDGSDRLVLEDMPVYADRADALARQGPDQEAGAIRYTKELSWDENVYASALVKKVALDNSASAQAVVAVPRTAIVEVGGATHVYVQRHPEAFDLMKVTTGRSNGRDIEITQGLREGQRIVIKGGDKMPRK